MTTQHRTGNVCGQRPGTYRGNALAVFLAQPEGLGIRAPKNQEGPTVRQFIPAKYELRFHCRHGVCGLQRGHCRAQMSCATNIVLICVHLGFIRGLACACPARQLTQKRMNVTPTNCRTFGPELLIVFLYPALQAGLCLLYTSPSPRDQRGSRMPSSA